MSTPRASIVLLTRNGGARLRTVLDAIASQPCRHQVEVLAVDSSSTDGSRLLLAERADVVLDIAPTDFNHGTTRNLGVGRARAPIAVLLVQDAVPQSSRWLERLIAPLEQDARLAGTFARQIPRADASPVVRHHLAHWVAAGAEARVVFADSAALDRLSPMERLTRCAFDNVCAAIRREVWTRHPFVATAIGEDIAWGREVLLAGYGLAYVPESIVEHSHDRSAWYELKRTWALHQQLHRLFGLRTIRTPADLARAVASTAALHRRLVSAAGGGAAAHTRAAALALAWPLGQYAGALTAARGRYGWRPGDA